MIIWVDSESYDVALAALPGHTVETIPMIEPDLVMSRTARYFEPEWFNDPKLVEVALKRARSDKKKRGKK